MKEALHIDHLPGRIIVADGKEYLYCSGTSYLGIAKNKTFSANLQEGLVKYGTNYSSSRISNLQLQIFEEAEAYLANFTGAEAAITLSSGFLTGQMVIRLLENSGEFIYAPRTHPAVWRKAGDFFDADFHHWTEQLSNLIARTTKNNLIIVTNSLDPLSAIQYDFNWIQRLPTHKKITLVVDDSHGFGIIGREGAGIFSELTQYNNITLIVVSSFGKAFGIPGGVVLADLKTIEQLRKNPFFGASSPVIPAYLYAFLKSESIYKQERKKLFANIHQFLLLLNHTELFTYFADYPVFHTRENTLCRFMKERGVLISSFPYPSPEDNLITRIVINSLHTCEDINTLATLINEFSPSDNM